MKGICRGLFLLIFFVSFSCEKFEPSPNITHDNDTPRNLNHHNIQRLLSMPNQDDTVKIIFTGDSQRFYEEAEILVDKANSIHNVDFLIHSGDISDFGLLKEFEWVDQIMSQLYMPYVTVLGNHDLVANGREVYKRMYGEENFSFVYDSLKFIFHNTNCREYNFNGQVPDLNYLEAELASSPQVNGVIAVSHIAPFDADFDKNLEKPYASLFARSDKFMASLHGHKHKASDSYHYDDKVRYIITNSMNKRQFLLLSVVSDTIIKTYIPY